jgi:hypothetical protein
MHAASMRLFSTAALLSLCTTALAQPLPLKDVPDPLKPWVQWVLFDEKDYACPPLLGQEGDEDAPLGCTWQSRLDLDVGQKRGAFSLRVTTYGTRLVPLPGNAKRWPLDVKVDGKAALVVTREGAPFVELPAGSHALSGVFQWEAMPEALAVPETIGLVSLTLLGKPVKSPQREDGSVFLAREAEEGEEEAEENRLDLTVHRLVRDGIPLTVETKIDIYASGKAREETIGPVLLKDFVPMSLDSVLPARLEQDGQLRVQVRPGRFTITLTARHGGSPKQLELLPSLSLWVPEEVWVVAPNASLRVIDIEGVDRIDPQQTTLPADWRHFETYRVRQKEVMRIVEKARGDSSPEPDKLKLERTIWLDFDGRGYTFRDRVTGVKNRGARLEMQSGYELGRVSKNGSDQFITRVDAQSLAGVQVAHGALTLEADSRLPRGDRQLSAVAWVQDFDSVSTQLHLPPGWRLFSVSGADNVPGTWFKRWSLLELFLVMIVTITMFRLYGSFAAVLACLALVLSVPEDGAPQLLWLAALGAEALVRYVPVLKLKPWLSGARGLVWIALAFVVFPFLSEQVRQTIFPTLEHEYQALGTGAEGGRNQGGNFEQTQAFSVNAPAAQIVDAEKDDESDEEERPSPKMKKSLKKPGAAADVKALDLVGSTNESLGGLGNSDVASNAPAKVQLRGRYIQNMYSHDPKAIVQTGPGVPAWQWNTFFIGYSGPVNHEQTLSLFLLPPWLVSLLGFLRVMLVFALFVVLLGMPGNVWPMALKKRFLANALLLAIVLFGSTADAQALPSEAQLEQLKDRLLREPLCERACVSAGRMSIEITGGNLRLRLEVSAAVTTGVPLPVDEQHWLPERVVVDEKIAELVRQDGLLYVRVEPGVHRITLEGPLPERDSMTLPMHLKPHVVEAKTPGWTVDGLHEDGDIEDLQLSRTEQLSKKAALQQGSLPAFVVIERRLTLGLAWQIDTTLRRLTPTGTAVVLEVPLLEGEQVTSDTVRVEGGKALVTLPAQASSLSWESVLKERPQIVLKAKADAPWNEVWVIEASPVWHYDAAGGLAPVRGEGATFRPWPGESLTLNIRRPEGVTGQTLTIDKATLTFTPGLRSSDSKLALQLRSSQGGQYVLGLPEGASVLSVKMNGVSQPIRKTGRELTVPVNPGAQSALIEFREERGVSTFLSSPEVNLGRPGVNAALELVVPAERWLLRAGGEGAGPAILFWGALIVIGLIAFVMGRVSRELGISLTAPQWFLLGLGLTQVEAFGVFMVFMWFVLLALRQRYIDRLQGFWFDAVQIVLLGWSIGFAAWLFVAIRNGLVMDPDMQVLGNGSSRALLRWYVDRTASAMPQALVVSVPVILYRALTLAWSLWLAFALLRWLKWAFAAFTAHGLYRPFEWRPWRWLFRS